MYGTNKKYQYHWRNQKKLGLGILWDIVVSADYWLCMLYYLTSISQPFLKISTLTGFSLDRISISILETKRHTQKSRSWGKAQRKKKKQNKQADLNALFHIHFNSHLDTILAISCCFLEKWFPFKHFWERTHDLKKQFRKVQRVVFFTYLSLRIACF